MSDPLDDIFDGEPQVEMEQAEPEAIEEDQEPEQAPDPEGKGVETAPPAEPEEKPQSIPISALLDEREKRQAAERREQEYQRRIQQYEQQQSQPKQDFFDNPEQAIAQLRAQFQHALWNERVSMSELMTRQAHGDEIVSKATDAFMEAARSNPALAMDLQRQANPYGFVVNWHKQQSMLADIGTDPAAYRERIRAELMAEMQAQQPAPVQTTKPTIPRSMAAAPSAGSVTRPVLKRDPLFDG